MKIVLHEDHDGKPVEDVYVHVQTDDGKPLIAYQECGSHAFYVSPLVLDALKTQHGKTEILSFDEWLEQSK